MPPADGRCERQAGTIPVSGPGVGPQLDGGAVPAGGAEQVGGFLPAFGADAPSDDFNHLHFVRLASAGLNGDFMWRPAAVK